MRRILLSTVVLIAVFGLAVGAAAMWFVAFFDRDGPLTWKATVIIRRGTGVAAIADEVSSELHPAEVATTEAELRREIPNRICTVYHPVGTCRMGTDERAVVDPTLRVRGIDAGHAPSQGESKEQRHAQRKAIVSMEVQFRQQVPKGDAEEHPGGEC